VAKASPSPPALPRRPRPTTPARGRRRYILIWLTSSRLDHAEQVRQQRKETRVNVRKVLTLKKLVVVIVIALSSNANAETFEQWVKNAGVHADRQMSPDQSREFFVDYYGSQGHHFDPNAVEFNAVASAVQ
jgi:hypothetical protein